MKSDGLKRYIHRSRRQAAVNKSIPFIARASLLILGWTFVYNWFTLTSLVLLFHKRMSPCASSTLRDLLQRRAEVSDSGAYIFLTNGEIESERLTYGELDRRARSIGAGLQRLAAAGERALLLYPPGLEFIAALFGCFYTGVVAVPAYPPRPHRTNSRLRSIALEARPTVALTTSAIAQRAATLESEIPQLRGIRWIATDALPAELAEEWRPAALTGDTLAFLQYTSGSTSTPKGVMVSHANFLHNERLIAEACGHSAETRFVGWLPLYHDMGLMGNVLQPLYLGGSCVLMAPAAFLQSPVRWLAAIGRYRATTSGGPNFAYDLCVRRINAEQRSGLDLSSWRVAFNGAEPVRVETLERFAEAFAGCGFRRQAFFPCYGLAEATLLVTGTARSRPPATLALDREALLRHRVVPAGEGAPGGRALVSCGRPGADQRLLIVDPESFQPCPAGQVGEIWVAGPSVAQGYWERPEETAAVFGAMPADAPSAEAEGGAFLRTGDLGFLWEGELYVTGRLKDLIVIRGQNHYPQDLEQTAERCHPALLPGSAAAFAVDRREEERLVLVLERQPRSGEGIAAVAPAVRWAIAAEHQIQVDTVVLVRAGTIPKTTSGKVRRDACRNLFLEGGLAALGLSALGEESEDWTADAPSREELLALDPVARRAALVAFLRTEVGRALRRDPAAGSGAVALDPRQPLLSLGLDSLAALELEQRIGQALGIAPPLERLLDGASLAELSDHLLDRLTAGAPSPLPPAATSGGGEIPLSAMQRALWFEQRRSPESSAYNIPFAARLEGEVDVPALSRALAALYERHPALRTTVALRDGEPVQRIAAGGELAFAERDAAASSAAELAAQVAAEAHRPFDLEREPLFRAVLFSRPPAERWLLLVAHHLVFDGWSLWVLLDELQQLYGAAVAQRSAELPLPGAGYDGFLRWQTELLAGAEGERLWDFWRAELAGEIALDLPFDRGPFDRGPFDRGRAPGPAQAGAAHFLRLGEERVRALRDLAQQSGTTLYTVLLTAYMVLLARYAGRDEVMVGTPVLGRSRPELRAVVGCLFNTVALRADLSGDPSFRALLARVRGKLAAALEHQDYPSSLLAERLRPGQQASGVPFFEAQFIFQQPHPLAAAVCALPDGARGLRLDLGSLTLDVPLIEPLWARSPLELELIETGGELIGQLRYSADLFAPATVARMAEHWENLLEEAAADADRPLSELDFLGRGEREQLCASFSRSAWGSAASGLVHELFAEQVARSPHRVAARHEERALTFAELAEEAGQLAHFLTGLDL
jgi:acyl-CoA synthetase (AMP-forming)/AMP-acid ligase II/acyl carrier protein